MITGGKTTASEGIALQQGILCSIAVKLIQKDRARTPIRNRAQHNCSCVRHLHNNNDKIKKMLQNLGIADQQNQGDKVGTIA